MSRFKALTVTVPNSYSDGVTTKLIREGDRFRSDLEYNVFTGGGGVRSLILIRSPEDPNFYLVRFYVRYVGGDVVEPIIISDENGNVLATVTYFDDASIEVTGDLFPLGNVAYSINRVTNRYRETLFVFYTEATRVFATVPNEANLLNLSGYFLSIPYLSLELPLPAGAAGTLGARYSTILPIYREVYTLNPAYVPPSPPDSKLMLITNLSPSTYIRVIRQNTARIRGDSNSGGGPNGSLSVLVPAFPASILLEGGSFTRIEIVSGPSPVQVSVYYLDRRATNLVYDDYSYKTRFFLLNDRTAVKPGTDLITDQLSAFNMDGRGFISPPILPIATTSRYNLLPTVIV